jgi:predicted dehydrogenase
VKKLRAGIIGLGVGERHIEGYRRHPRCEVAAVCDISEERLSQVRALYPGLRCTAHAEEILQDPSIDVVSIASYDNYHFEQIEMGMNHGKHLFVEKPLCLYDWQLARIRTLLKANPHLKISSNLVLRCSPRFMQLRQMIAAGGLGRLYYMEGDYEYGRLAKLTQGWRGQIDYYSAILGGAVHLIDLLLWLSQDTVTEVTALGNRIASDGSAFRFDDFVVCLLKFSSGMLAKVTANLGCVKSHFHGLKIFGTKATFENGPDQGRLYKCRAAESPPEPLTAAYPGVVKGELVYNFIQSICEEVPAVVGMEDIFKTMSVCMAAERSLAQAATVAVDYF